MRGPAFAVALGGCVAAAPEPSALAPEPGAAMQPVTVERETSEVAAARREAERLERLDRALAAADHRRADRIEDQRRAREAAVVQHYPSISIIGCGRG